MNIGWKLDNDAKIDPPIHEENFLYGGSNTLIDIVEGAKAVTSFFNLSFKSTLEYNYFLACWFLQLLLYFHIYLFLYPNRISELIEKLIHEHLACLFLLFLKAEIEPQGIQKLDSLNKISNYLRQFNFHLEVYGSQIYWYFMQTLLKSLHNRQQHNNIFILYPQHQIELFIKYQKKQHLILSLNPLNIKLSEILLVSFFEQHVIKQILHKWELLKLANSQNQQLFLLFFQKHIKRELAAKPDKSQRLETFKTLIVLMFICFFQCFLEFKLIKQGYPRETFVINQQIHDATFFTCPTNFKQCHLLQVLKY